MWVGSGRVQLGASKLPGTLGARNSASRRADNERIPDRSRSGEILGVRFLA